MLIYTILEAIAGDVLGLLIAIRSKKASGVVYGKLDYFCCLTNLVLLAIYAMSSPSYVFLGVISEPEAEGFLMIPACIVAIIIASATFFCFLGLGLSVAMRKKGKTGASFAVQCLGAGAIILAVVLYMLSANRLLVSFN